MPRVNVNDIAPGENDLNGRLVVSIYTRQPDRYAVYQTDDRVVVCYADDPLVQRIQRKRLAALAVLRSEIDGMLAPWRGKPARWSRLALTARQYDMRVHPALVEALEGRPDVGLAILAQVKADIAGEMASRARLAYVMWASGSAVALMAICVLIHAVVGAWSAGDPLVPPLQRRLLLAGMGTGILGALYSIAMRIRQRALDSDMRRLDFATDSFVRLGLGAVGAFILECFLVSGAIELRFGEIVPPAVGETSSLPSIYIVLIAGFLAGFVERLVPDLLNSYAVAGRKGEDAAPAPSPASTAPAPGAPVAEPDPDDPTETDEDAVIAAPSAEEGVDGCAVDLTDPAQATPDDELPASTGGVARS